MNTLPQMLFENHPHVNLDLGIHLNDSSMLQDRTFFHTLAHLSGKRNTPEHKNHGSPQQ